VGGHLGRQAWMGSNHFLTKPRATEMSLNVLAYNFKRVMQIIAISLKYSWAPAPNAKEGVWARDDSKLSATV
jgi:hypothetical protein